METRVLGSSGIEVGEIGLGCMGMSHGYDVGTGVESESIAVIDRALDRRDAARHVRRLRPHDTNGELVGRALVGHWEEAVLPPSADRAGTSAAPSASRIGPARVRPRGDGRVLARLGVDHVDLYELHRVDPEGPGRGDVARSPSWSPPARRGRSGSRRSRSEGSRLPTRSIPFRPCRASSRSGPATGRPRCCRGASSTASAFLPFSPLGRGFLTGALSGREIGSEDLPRRSAALLPQAMAENQAIVDAVASVAEPLTTPPRRRSRSRGCSPRVRRSCRSPAPSGSRGSRRTPRPPSA